MTATAPYFVPDNPADPEAAALDLIVRSTEVLDDPVGQCGSPRVRSSA
jgi:hypothetical protein